MKTPLLKISVSLVSIALFFILIFSMKNDDLPNYDPEKELAHLLVNKNDETSENTNNGGGTNTSSETSEENSKPNKVSHSQEAIEYFNTIVFNSEFTGKRSTPLKWTEDMKIYVDGSKVSNLTSELKRIISELNDIIDPIDIKIVNNKSDANFFIFLGGYEDFKETYEVVYPSRLNNNWGYFEVYPSNYGIMYVDIYRATNVDAQKHLLREELTQSLGLLNDSYKYPESIFYQGWTTTTEYAPIDRELIDMLYNN
jgi:hypothetical protein